MDGRTNSQNIIEEGGGIPYIEFTSGYVTHTHSSSTTTHTVVYYPRKSSSVESVNRDSNNKRYCAFFDSYTYDDLSSTTYYVVDATTMPKSKIEDYIQNNLVIKGKISATITLFIRDYTFKNAITTENYGIYAKVSVIAGAISSINIIYPTTESHKKAYSKSDSSFSLFVYPATSHFIENVSIE